MDGVLYSIVYSEENKKIRFLSDEDETQIERHEVLLAQVEGSEDAASVESLIIRLRPDIEVIGVK